MATNTRRVDLRGNTRDRRARREWMLSPEAGFGGNGTTVPCYWCGRRLSKPESDRYPQCGHSGGRYTRDNVVPACRACNSSRCNDCKREVAENDGLLSRETPRERGSGDSGDSRRGHLRRDHGS